MTNEETTTVVENEEVKTDAEPEAEAPVEEEKFDREYVEELRKQSANYRTSAKAANEKVADLEKQIADLTKSNEDLTGKAGEVETLNLNVLRYKVAALHGIKSEEDIDLFLTGTDEETLTKQAQRISTIPVSSPKPDPAQGNRSTTHKPTVGDQLVNDLSRLFN